MRKSTKGTVLCFGFLFSSLTAGTENYVYYQNHKTSKKKEQKVFVNVKLGPYFYIVLTINIAFAF